MEELSFKNHYGDTLFGSKWEIENPQNPCAILRAVTF